MENVAGVRGIVVRIGGLVVALDEREPVDQNLFVDFEAIARVKPVHDLESERDERPLRKQKTLDEPTVRGESIEGPSSFLNGKQLKPLNWTLVYHLPPYRLSIRTVTILFS